jgi:hypothetical protein
MILNAGNLFSSFAGRTELLELATEGETRRVELGMKFVE